MLERSEWALRSRDHAAAVDALTAGHRARRARGEKHPVEDFLFTYYPFRVSALRRWHPGPGVLLADAAGDERARWRHYAAVGDAVRLDRTAYLGEHQRLVRSVRDLLAATAGRPPQLACFGLHEWAMVYRLPGEQVRHAGWPLRLEAQGTDAVVEASALRCTHVDAYRFFTDAARPRNELRPTRQEQRALEQPGCLHAGMDLYKEAMRLGPGVPSELTLECFLLARDLRALDMRASPYDLRALGYEPVRVETAAGRAEYVRLQRRYAGRAQALRLRLVRACDALLGVDSPDPASAPVAPVLLAVGTVEDDGRDGDEQPHQPAAHDREEEQQAYQWQDRHDDVAAPAEERLLGHQPTTAGRTRPGPFGGRRRRWHAAR